ncbi:coiled-coil domain-containing protein 77-like [Apostichopus japonicus]|uniref:coiled-coil domain-containing protein 77-like n=1 Tax=Stichopus japonicus TaxID=307972 RepID=UPI003AB81CCF
MANVRPDRQPRTPGRSPRGHQNVAPSRFGDVNGFYSLEDVDDDVEAPIPSINERLGHLRPSRELLEYYRKKIAEFDEEHEEMLKKLENYKVTYEQQHNAQWEIRQREEEIAELQKALSDMQVYLFQEREQVLRLYSENDRLKIRELEDRKRIQHLLSLGAPGEPEITYFFKKPPARPMVRQRKPLKQHPHESDGFGLQSEVSGSSCRQHRQTNARSAKGTKKGKPQLRDENEDPGKDDLPDSEVLLLQIEALQGQLEEQTRLAKEQADALMDDRKVRMEELQTVIDRDRAKMESLQAKLHHTQNLLYDSTKDFLGLKYQGRAKEKQWMAEKDRLLRELDHCKEQLNVSKEDVLHISDHVLEQRQSQSLEMESMEQQLDQAQRLAEMYREQVISMEENLSRIREKEDVSKEVFKGRTEKLSTRLQLMNKRYEALEKRRNLEVEGFKNDIKILRTRLKDVEKQLYKVSLGFGEDGDMKMLTDVHRTAKRSKRMQSDLHQLKAAIYGMENDLRCL